MDLRWLVVTLLLGISCSIGADQNRKIFVIYDGFLEVIQSKGTTKSQKFLDKHFFTSNKYNSIWPLALNDTFDILRKKFDRADYITFEKDLLKLQALWRNCVNGASEREDCGKEIFGNTRRFMKDFQWTHDFPEFSRRNYFSIRVAYQAMEILMWKILAEDPLVETKKEIVHWYESLKEEYDQAMKYFVDFMIRLKEERPFDLSVIEVCPVKEFIWQQFENEDVCEKRWNKNVNTQKDKPKPQTTNKDVEVNDEISGDNEENTKEQEEIFYKTFSPDLEKVDAIGGKTTDFSFIMKAKFTDYGGKKIINIGEKTSDLYTTPKSEVIEELVGIGYDKRQEYERKIVKEMENYILKTFGKVQKAGEVLLQQINVFQQQYVITAKARNNY